MENIECCILRLFIRTCIRFEIYMVILVVGNYFTELTTLNNELIGHSVE